ncbi:Hypothetical protein A7982_05043 [Minicystis rosea]|nr:Hypothetical protein A7982_05043 [Minicystis rosea]
MGRASPRRAASHAQDERLLRAISSVGRGQQTEVARFCRITFDCVVGGRAQRPFRCARARSSKWSFPGEGCPFPGNRPAGQRARFG